MNSKSLIPSFPITFTLPYVLHPSVKRNPIPVTPEPEYGEMEARAAWYKAQAFLTQLMKKTA